REVTEIVSMVDRQTEGIAHSTSLIQTSVDRVKAGLSEFAGDARENGGQLLKVESRLSHLEMLSNTMLNTLANSGAEIDDTPMILKGQAEMRDIAEVVERGIDRGEITLEEVFDRNYRERPGSNPKQFDTNFCAFADRHVQPIIDAVKATDHNIIGTTIGDINGHLPTHLSDRSQAQGDDPVWNDAHCRNRRILIDDQTRFALQSDEPTLMTYLMQRGEESIAVKNVYIPLFIKGRRWGNVELAYRDS
ncbi:MAG: chemotaxis protein, partial [Sphingomonas sp.]|nr:chemotaxis protein [Sphingomonas sp.]